MDIDLDSFETVINSKCQFCIANASNSHVRGSEWDIFGMRFSGNLLFQSKFVSLFHNFGNEYQSRPQKQGFLKHSTVLWALFQHCSCVTSLRARVSVPGPSLNISHCRSLLGSLRAKGNHNKLCSATSPSTLSLFLPPSLPLSLSLALPLSSHHAAFSFLFFPNLWALGVLPSLPYLCYHLLPSSQSDW